MVEINVPGFAVGELLGRGGFGSVYRASDVAHGRDVAVKILDGDLGEEERRRFDRERASMGALGAHPNIVPVFDSGYTEDGRAYLVMEYAAGSSLRRRMDVEGPLGWAEAVSTMAAVARGVAAAHGAGILHRDIKPDNILIDSYGNPKLADFGIATVVSGATTTKGASTTLAHAAPELLEGQPAATTMDIYALGSTLHNLITGSPPFARPGDELAAPMLRRILSDPPPDLAELGVPAAVAAVVAKALEKAPADRHESAEAFADALERAAADAAAGVHVGGDAPVGAAPTVASSDVAASLAPTLDPDPSGLLADVGASAPTAHSRRGRVGLLLAIPAVAIAAAVGGVLLSNSGDDDSVEPTDTEVAGPTITSTSTTATTNSSAAAERLSVTVDCPDEIAVGEKIVCSIDSVGATGGSWEIPGFTSGRVELDTVPGSNSIFVEPTNPAFIGTTFTLRVIVTGPDGDQATASHRFDVVSGDDSSGESTATTAVTRTTAAPAAAAPTSAPATTRAPTTAAPTTAAPTTAAPTTAAPTTTAAPAPSVSINCPGAIKLNTSITCEIVSANASSGSWSLPGFFGGSLALSVPGSNPVFINPTNPEVVGRTFTISATVQGINGQTASTSRSFTVTE